MSFMWLITLNGSEFILIILSRVRVSECREAYKGSQHANKRLNDNIGVHKINNKDKQGEDDEGWKIKNNL